MVFAAVSAVVLAPVLVMLPEAWAWRPRLRRWPW
jgi:hypothetical protein